MPFVKRNEAGDIIAISQHPEPGIEEEVAFDDPGLVAFLTRFGSLSGSFELADQAFIRVLEDLIGLLIDKGVIMLTELPPLAQQKILERKQLRSKLMQGLDLIDDEQ